MICGAYFLYTGDKEMAFGDEYLSMRCLSAMVCQNTDAKFLLDCEGCI